MRALWHSFGHYVVYCAHVRQRAAARCSTFWRTGTLSFAVAKGRLTCDVQRAQLRPRLRQRAQRELTHIAKRLELHFEYVPWRHSQGRMHASRTQLNERIRLRRDTQILTPTHYRQALH